MYLAALLLFTSVLVKKYALTDSFKTMLMGQYRVNLRDLPLILFRCDLAVVRRQHKKYLFAGCVSDSDRPALFWLGVSRRPAALYL